MQNWPLTTRVPGRTKKEICCGLRRLTPWDGREWNPIRVITDESQARVVILTRVPHAAGGRGKKRPAVVIQADRYNQSERHIIVVEITSNLSRAADAANLLIEIMTPEGQATGLAQDSLATCLQLATISENRVSAVIGKLSAAMLVKLNDCLKVTLEIP